MTDITPALLAEIALEMTLQTGQVYTCPDETHITAPGLSYYVRERNWPRPVRLSVDFDGPNNQGPHRSETITLDPSRPAARIAADILRRLPPDEGRAYFEKCRLYQEARAQERAAQAETVKTLQALGLTCYEHGDHSARMHQYGTPINMIEIYNGKINRAHFGEITPAQLIKIMEILK